MKTYVWFSQPTGMNHSKLINKIWTTQWNLFIQYRYVVDIYERIRKKLNLKTTPWINFGCKNQYLWKKLLTDTYQEKSFIWHYEYLLSIYNYFLFALLSFWKASRITVTCYFNLCRITLPILGKESNTRNAPENSLVSHLKIQTALNLTDFI